MHHFNLLAAPAPFEAERTTHAMRQAIGAAFGANIPDLPIDRPQSVDRTPDVIAGLADWRARVAASIDTFARVPRRSPGERRIPFAKEG